jgi:hypothetical protein
VESVGDLGDRIVVRLLSRVGFGCFEVSSGLVVLNDRNQGRVLQIQAEHDGDVLDEEVADMKTSRFDLTLRGHDPSVLEINPHPVQRLHGAALGQSDTDALKFAPILSKVLIPQSHVVMLKTENQCHLDRIVEREDRGVLAATGLPGLVNGKLVHVADEP